MKLKLSVALVSVFCIGIAFFLGSCSAENSNYNSTSGICTGYDQTSSASIPGKGKVHVQIFCLQNNQGHAIKFVFSLDPSSPKGFQFRNPNDTVDIENYTGSGNATSASRTVIGPDGKKYVVTAYLPLPQGNETPKLKIIVDECSDEFSLQPGMQRCPKSN